MDAIRIYKCFCDPRRLRILNLLHDGPLCVCHLQTLLGESQVAVSKQLAYMREFGLLDVERRGTWRMYRLAEPQPTLLRENLRCLQDAASEHPVFRDDLDRRRELAQRIESAPVAPADGCPKP